LEETAPDEPFEALAEMQAECWWLAPVQTVVWFAVRDRCELPERSLELCSQYSYLSARAL
jgi:hypothetical protein